MPSLPAMALITAVVLTQVKNISLRKFLYSITGITTLLTILYNGFIPKPPFLPYLGARKFANHPTLANQRDA